MAAALRSFGSAGCVFVDDASQGGRVAESNGRERVHERLRQGTECRHHRLRRHQGATQIKLPSSPQSSAARGGVGAGHVHPERAASVSVANFFGGVHGVAQICKFVRKVRLAQSEPLLQGIGRGDRKCGPLHML